MSFRSSMIEILHCQSLIEILDRNFFTKFQQMILKTACLHKFQGRDQSEPTKLKLRTRKYTFLEKKFVCYQKNEEGENLDYKAMKTTFFVIFMFQIYLLSRNCKFFKKKYIIPEHCVHSGLTRFGALITPRKKRFTSSVEGSRRIFFYV